MAAAAADDAAFSTMGKLEWWNLGDLKQSLRWGSVSLSVSFCFCVCCSARRKVVRIRGIAKHSFLARTFEFPTPTEHLLWMIASLFTLFFSFICGLFFFYIDFTIIRKQQRNEEHNFTLQKLGHFLPCSLFPKHLSSWSNERSRTSAGSKPINFDRGPVVPLGFLITTGIFCVIYFFAWAFILIKYIISLRSLPSSRFTTGTWTQNLTHN